MFDPSSRYFDIPVTTLTATAGDGPPREIRYVRRRFLPRMEGATIVAEHTVTQGDRLDNVAARYLGDPELFWHICDANNVMRPTELTDTVGQIIRVAIPKL